MGTSDSEFYDALGGQASTGIDHDGLDVGMSMLAFPDGTVRVTLAHEGPDGFRYLGVQVYPGIAAEWGMLLSLVAREAEATDVG